MRTLSDLRKAGFLVEIIPNEFPLTLVTSSKPFWYYNQELYSTLPEVNERLMEASLEVGRYQVGVNGIFPEDKIFTFNLLDAERRALLVGVRHRYVAACNDMRTAEDDYQDVLATNEPYEL